MENIYKIKSFSYYPFVDSEQAHALMETVKQRGLAELLIFPDQEDSSCYRAVMLQEFYTENLGKAFGVDEVRREGPYVILVIHGNCVRGFISNFARKINPTHPVRAESRETPFPTDWLLGQETSVSQSAPRMHPIEVFLRDNPPAKIEQTLNEHIMGQPAMTAAVADFLYYHALRQLHPQLPPRPLLITGPSGCGKTEAWRKVSELYGNIFAVKIIDGSSLSCDGWAGNFKVSSFLDKKLAEGGILVVDEFDKLVKPKFSSGGGNVSLDMQAELLKLMEGDYRITEQKKDTGKTTRQMGFVMTGAFHELQKRVYDVRPAIGFCTQQTAKPCGDGETLENADFIRYGVMPELMGRIAVRCQVHQLSDKAYLDIIKGPHSRVTQLSKVLEQYGVDVSGVIPDGEILELIAQSRHCQTGVRWVSAQVENRILERIRERGLFAAPAAA